MTLLLLAPDSRGADGDNQAPSPPVSTQASAPEPAEEAAIRYRKGRELYEQKAWDQALAEFLASRKIHSTWKATSAAALSLKQLSRFDEALDMFEALLREYGTELSAEAKSEAQRQVVELRGRVGTIDVQGAEPGAAVAVDGQIRGEFPLLAPLRVPVGSHLVRVTKEGFEPFETRVDVAGARLEVVSVRLRALVRSGRVRVAEQNGRVLEVVIDGGAVGKTPWEGSVSPGEHVIVLRGEGNFGTPPVPVNVAMDQTLPLTLVAEELQAAVRVVPTPVNANVVIDGVTVGRGVWEGRLRKGAHTVDVAAEGFVAATQKITLDAGEREVLSFSLTKDLSSPLWRKPPRVFAEGAGAFLLAPTFGGSIAGCADPCESGVGLGGQPIVRAGYMLGLGIEFGVTVGWVGIAQSVTNRRATFTPVGRPPREAIVTDELELRGMAIGGFAGYTFGETYPVRVRLEAGGISGSVRDERSGTFVATDGKQYGIGPARESSSVSFFWVNPQAHVGKRLGDHFEVSAGLGIVVLVPLSQPAWDVERELGAATDGIATFGADTFVGSALVMMAPEIGLRYTF